MTIEAKPPVKERLALAGLRFAQAAAERTRRAGHRLAAWPPPGGVRRKLDGFGRFELTMDRVVALLIAPFLLLIAMPLIVVVHDLMEEVLLNVTGGGFLGMDFFVTLASLTLFLLLVYGVYHFVRTGGKWLLGD